MTTRFKTNLNVRDTESEVATALLQICVYTVFAIVTTVISLSSPSTELFFFRQSLDALFINRENEYLRSSFEYLVSIKDWIEFVEMFFFSKLHSYAQSSSNQNITDGPLLIEENYLFGMPRMRQIRVMPTECAYRPPLKTTFQTCYPAYSYGAEQTTPKHKGTRYYHRYEFRALPFLGNAVKYNGPGYLVNLGVDYEMNTAIFDHMKAIQWIDEGTRLVIIELIVYNIDTLLIATVQLCAEVLPTGTIIPQWEIDMVPLITIWSPNTPSVLCASIIFFALVVFYTSVEVQELLESGPRTYFSSSKNYIDIIILTSAFVYIELSILSAFNFYYFVQKLTKKPGSLISLDIIYFRHCATLGSMAICVFLVWAKVLRFIGFNTTMIQFQTTLRRCTKDILGFATMFTVVFMGFSLSGMIIFGDSRKDFSTFQNAFFSMVRMVLGDFQYTDYQYTNRVLCPAFYLIYVLFISLILLNMFLAIINNTYTDVKQEIREERNPLKILIVNYYRRLKNKISRKTKKKQDQKTYDRHTLNAEDDMRSMFEFTDVKLQGDTVTIDAVSRTLQRPFHRPYRTSTAEISSKEDRVNEELIRLTERVDLIESILDKMTSNVQQILHSADANPSPNTNES